MLNLLSMPPSRGTPRARQGGVVLMMALIVLVAMTLAGIALVRSVNTSNIIAGNLAFQQAATHAGDTGTEAAVGWLEANNTAALWGDLLGQGYTASRSDPGLGQSWDNFWSTSLVPTGQVVTLAPDAAGNTVAYTIQRLCNIPGDPTSAGPPPTGCEVTQSAGAGASSSRAAGNIALLFSSQIYYRITARIAGPRNTISYVQTIVAL